MWILALFQNCEVRRLMLGYSSSLCPRLCFTLEKSGWFTCSLFFPSAASVCVIRVSGVLLYFFLRFAALVLFSWSLQILLDGCASFVFERWCGVVAGLAMNGGFWSADFVLHSSFLFLLQFILWLLYFLLRFCDFCRALFC